MYQSEVRLAEDEHVTEELEHSVLVDAYVAKVVEQVVKKMAQGKKIMRCSRISLMTKLLGTFLSKAVGRENGGDGKRIISCVF